MGMYGQRDGGTRVTVRKQRLLDALRKNREGHRQTFLKAQEGYRQLCIEHLDTMLANARANRTFDTVVRLQAPTDHTKEYDINIQMLEMAEDDTLVISYEQFQHFVLDDWEWRQEFITNSAQYIGGV